MQETWVRSLGWEDPLEKEKVTHSSILAWEIPWIEEPGGLQPMGSQRVQDWTANTINIRTEVSELWEVLQVSGPCGYFYLVVESCPTLLQPYGLQPARLLNPWDFPGKNTGVGYHKLVLIVSMRRYICFLLCYTKYYTPGGLKQH